MARNFIANISEIQLQKYTVLDSTTGSDQIEVSRSYAVVLPKSWKRCYQNTSLSVAYEWTDSKSLDITVSCHRRLRDEALEERLSRRRPRLRSTQSSQELPHRFTRTFEMKPPGNGSHTGTL